ncbi:MAG: TolC family protein [Gemmatimonadota bacterium]
MGIRIVVIIALIVALASSAASAQVPALPAGLSRQHFTGTDSLLHRLTMEAMAAPAILQSDATARAAATRVRPAGALPDPMVNVGVMDLTLPRFAFHQSDFTEVDVELSQQFPWPGTLSAKTRAARAMERGARAGTAVLRREAALRVAMLYYRLRYVVSAEETLTRQRRLLQSVVEISTSRYATGSVPESDPLQARVAFARLGTEEASLQAEDAGLRADLRAARGIQTPEQLSIAPIEADSVHAILEDAEHEHAAHLAMSDPLTGHPRLELRRAEIESAEETARAERLTARPDFEVITRYGARPVGSDFFSAFVGIRIPLWAGRKQRLLTEATRIDAQVAEQGLSVERDALNAELDRTLADARAGATRLRLLVESVLPLARENVDAALRGYRTGQTDFLSVLTAEDADYRAELEAIEVAAEHLTHLVMLDQLLMPEVGS